MQESGTSIRTNADEKLMFRQHLTSSQKEQRSKWNKVRSALPFCKVAEHFPKFIVESLEKFQ